MFVCVLLIIAIPQVLGASQNGSDDKELIAVEESRLLQDEKLANLSSAAPLNSTLDTTTQLSDQAEETFDIAGITQLVLSPLRILLKILVTPQITQITIVLYVIKIVLLNSFTGPSDYLISPLLTTLGLGSLGEAIDDSSSLIHTTFEGLICSLSQLSIIPLFACE